MPSIAEELDKIREANKQLEKRIQEIERRMDMTFPPPQPPRVRSAPNPQPTTRNPQDP